MHGGSIHADSEATLIALLHSCHYRSWATPIPILLHNLAPMPPRSLRGCTCGGTAGRRILELARTLGLEIRAQVMNVFIWALLLNLCWSNSRGD